MRSTSPATGAATSGPRTRPTRWPPPPTTSPAPAGSRGGPGAWRCGCPTASTTPAPTSRTAARSPTGAARGVTAVDGSALPDHGAAAIIAPAGARGPAFAVCQNFFVIKRYNNATSYAMGVGHLGDRIAGGGPISGAWPRGERELSRTEKIELQERLISRGFPTGATDGVIGAADHRRDPRLPGAGRPDAGRLRHRAAAGRAALMAERGPRLAVLIDADNTSPKIADGLFDEIAKIGEASLRRIYGDVSRGQHGGWEKILARHAILWQQQFAYTTGKNSSDITPRHRRDGPPALRPLRRLLPGLLGQRLHPARGAHPRAGGRRLRHRPGQDARELPPGLHPLHLHRELRRRRPTAPGRRRRRCAR